MAEIAPGTSELIRRSGTTTETVAVIKPDRHFAIGRIDRTEANTVANEAVTGISSGAQGRTTRSIEAVASHPSTAAAAMWSTIGVRVA